MPHEQIPKNEDMFVGNEWVLPTDIELVEQVAENFSKLLAEAGWSEDEIDTLHLAFIEALINAIAHGNLKVESDKNIPTWKKALEKQKEGSIDKKVYISLDITSGEISVTIRDEGDGFSKPENQTIPDPDPNNLETLLPFGRGSGIMERAFDSITRNEKGNEVTMTKKRNL